MDHSNFLKVVARQVFITYWHILINICGSCFQSLDNQYGLSHIHKLHGNSKYGRATCQSIVQSYQTLYSILAATLGNETHMTAWLS